MFCEASSGFCGYDGRFSIFFDSLIKNRGETILLKQKRALDEKKKKTRKKFIDIMLHNSH